VNDDQKGTEYEKQILANYRDIELAAEGVV
jgi:hypothetical protein